MFGFLILAPILLLATAGTQGADTGINGGEFQTMCRFIKVLKAPVKLPEIKYGDGRISPGQLATSDLSQIGELVLATSNDAIFSQLTKENQAETNNSPPDDMIPKEDWERMASAWKTKEKNSGESNRNPTRPPTGIQREKSNRRIVKIYNDAKSLVGKVERHEENIKDLVFEARRKQVAAIYGEEAIREQMNQKEGKSSDTQLRMKVFDSLQVVDKSFGGGAVITHAKLCGGEAGAAETGLSMVSDLNCLCAIKTSANNENICGKHSGNLGGPGGGWSAAGALKTLADNVLKGCDLEKIPGVEFSTPEKLMSIVNQFHGMLGKNPLAVASSSLSSAGDKKAKSQFILGAHSIHNSGGVSCEGTAASWNSATKGVCVNYAHHLEKGDEVPWVKQVLEAASKIREAEGNISMLLPLISRIENLRTTAQIYYDNAFDDSSGPATTTSPTSQSGKRESTQPTLSGTEKELQNSGSRRTLIIVFIPALFPLFLLQD